MSKRCELQKEYYQAKGNYKGKGKYSDDYVKWLENEVIALRDLNNSDLVELSCKLQKENPVLSTHRISLKLKNNR